jgi:hypothetical protein
MSENRVAGAQRCSWPLVFRSLCMLLLVGTSAFDMKALALNGETVTLSGTEPVGYLQSERQLLGVSQASSGSTPVVGAHPAEDDPEPSIVAAMRREDAPAPQ